MIQRPGALCGRPALAPTLALTFALTLALGGCISLFPKAAPVQLYRFDAQAPPVQSSVRPFAVRTGIAEFPPGAGGDRIMTISGDEVAFIADGRWVSPASQLFQEALGHGFDAPGDPARLIGPAQGKADYRLRLDVNRFETRYASGPTAPPTVTVVVRATLDRTADLTLVATQEFTAEIPAADNRIGAIVQAYDAAVSKVVGDMVAWVDQKGAG
jgi:cholesterol transport system auxiliary component